MYYQEAIIRTIVKMLSQTDEIVNFFKSGKGFTYLIRDYTFHNSFGNSIYKNKNSLDHCKFSLKAYDTVVERMNNKQSMDAVFEGIHPEDRVPISQIKEQLKPDLDFDEIRKIMTYPFPGVPNEIVYILKNEADKLDKKQSDGINLKSQMAPGNTDRLSFRDIKIHSKTRDNHL